MVGAKTMEKLYDRNIHGPSMEANEAASGLRHSWAIRHKAGGQHRSISLCSVPGLRHEILDGYINLISHESSAAIIHRECDYLDGHFNRQMREQETSNMAGLEFCQSIGTGADA